MKKLSLGLRKREETPAEKRALAAAFFQTGLEESNAAPTPELVHQKATPKPVGKPRPLTKAKTPARHKKGVRGPGKLSRGDKALLQYLELCRVAAGEGPLTPPLGLGRIAEDLGMGKRTVQECADRLVANALIRRVGYDPGAADKSQRGMIYEILIAPARVAETAIPKGLAAWQNDPNTARPT